MTAAATLLELLEHADGDQLLVLLESENLLKVLEHHGRDREQLKRELSRGASPGTLLLALFGEGHTAADLIALLPADALAKVKAQADARAAVEAPSVPGAPAGGSSSGRAPVTSSTGGVQRAASSDPGRARGLPVAFVVYLMALVVPSMLASGALPEWTVPPMVAIAIAAIGAGGAGLFASRAWPLRIAGSVAGVLSAPGAVLLTLEWLALRGSAMRIELALTVIIGALPGALFFALASALHRALRRAS